MRYARLKPESTDTFMHVYNRVAGSEGEYPFGDVEKEEFIRRLLELREYYVVDVVAFQCMGNHFHALIHIPTQPPSPEEAAERYCRHHGGKKHIDPRSPRAQALALRLRDISCFMADLEQPFTRWFNRTRSLRRRGHLWAERFKNTVLDNGLALWQCWKYIEMNPVRAGLVGDPADYRFCSFGRWAGTGRNPCAEAVERWVMPRLQGLLQVNSQLELQRELRKDFARIAALEAGKDSVEVAAAVAIAERKVLFSTRIDRRVRYWVDGIVIGSEQFVRETLAHSRGRLHQAQRPLFAARDAADHPVALYSFRRLRTLLQ